MWADRRDEWHFNYLGLFLSVSGIILVVTCALIAYKAADFGADKLDGEVAASTLPATSGSPPATILPSTTSTAAPPTTTPVAATVDQALLKAVNELLATTKTKLAAYEAAKQADPYDLVTTRQLAGELAVLWNSAPPTVLGTTPWAAQYNAAREQVGQLFLTVYSLIQQPRDFSNIDDAEAQVETVAIPLIAALESAIGP